MVVSEGIAPGFRTVADIDAALRRRLVLGQAQGIVMERLGLSAERAYAFLSRTPQQTNTNIHELAAQVAETRVIPGVAPSIAQPRTAEPRTPQPPTGPHTPEPHAPE